MHACFVTEGAPYNGFWEVQANQTGSLVQQHNEKHKTEEEHSQNLLFYAASQQL
jgi:hypothetical protein